MSIMQRTIGAEIETSGVGLHRGNQVSLKLIPAPVNTGIVFRRVDLTPSVDIKITPSLVRETKLCTEIITDDNVHVKTIEHLMAAISAFGIDNLIIELDSEEVPIMDGSSAAFVMLFQEVGVVSQNASKQFIRVLKKVRVEAGDKFAELLPSNENKFNLDFTIDFQHPAIPKELSHYNMDLTTQNFIDQLSFCRTFGFMRDIEYLQSIGLCRGGNLSNAIVLDNDRILNESGLRCADEFVRHKMLDAIGDLYLCNLNIIGQYRAFKSGHELNNLLIRKLLETENAFEVIVFADQEKASSMEFANVKVTA